MQKESIFKTLFVAFAVCAVCSVLVAGARYMLKDTQEINKALDKKRNILMAAGVINSKGYLLDDAGKPTEERGDVEKEFKNLEAVVIDLKTGKPDKSIAPEAIAKIDERELAKKKETSIEIPTKEDIAKIKAMPDKSVIYLLKDASGQVKRYVFPIYGKGLWSTMYGFIALDSDLNTVGNINFYDHGETPGLGGEIANPNWQSKWVNKKAFNAQGKPVIHVVKGSPNPADADIAYEVDGISGSTLTGNGVTKAVQYWLGENGFGPYLKSLRTTE